ncbi:MAG TPA: hypothetical protein VKZ96_11045 [Thermomicrobiales bacterium]|nr:hypothetical protein [Thermomicrobiales bacterium]
MSTRPRAHRAPRRSVAILLAALLTLLSFVPALGQAASETPALAADGPADGMLLVIQPSPGGVPPNSLQRIYPDETGLATVAFDEPLDIRRALLSPDGSEIAMYVITSGNVGRIYISSADGKRLDMLPVDATHMGLEDWHPGGEELLVWHFTGGQYDLKRLDRSGGLTALTNTPGINERNGRWAPDGARFSFTAPGLNGQDDVFVQAVGSTAVNITNSPESEGAAEWSPAGNRLLYARAGNLIVSDVSGANPRLLSPRAALLSYGWSPGEVIYASDVDGAVSTAPDDGSALTGLLDLETNAWVSDWGAAWTAPLRVLPDRISLSVERGAPDPAPITVLVNSEDFVTPWTASSGASWLTVTPVSGQTSGEIAVSLKTSNLQSGLYAAPITFLPGPKTLNVTLAVNEPGTGGNLTVAPGQLTFYATQGESNPPPLTLSVSSIGSVVNWVASESADWLSINPVGGSTPDTVTVAVNTSGLAPGHHETVIGFEPGGIQVPVNLELYASSGQAGLQLVPTILNFDVYDGQPPAQQLTIQHPGGDSVAWTAVASANWLRLSSYSGTTPAVVDVTVDPTGLPAGTYTATITTGQATATVNLTVHSGAPPSGDLIVTPGTLQFAAIDGGGEPGVNDVLISSASGQPVNWTATASEPWLILSATSGTTPATLKARADVTGLSPGTHRATLTIGDQTIPAVLHLIEGATPSPEFYVEWSRQDLPVDVGAVNRTWLWGPGPKGTTTEPYAEAPGGRRVVQYYDKSRMEVTYPDADPDGEGWYVTNGLLAYELITGQLQLGDNLFLEGTPAYIPIAGDHDDTTGPRYATFSGLLDAAPLPDGSVVTQVVDADGNVTSDSRLAAYGVTVGAPDPTTGHTVASVFNDYLRSEGLIWDGVEFTQGPLFEPWFFATGLPVTEPYWARVKLRGVVQDVLVQCFERRCLTYAPSNPEGWRVEQGNVGMHYFRWRYERPD